MDILNGKVRPLYFRYLAAASGSALVASVFGIVDAMMVGQYHGPAGNAALAVFNPLWSIIYSLGLLAGIGGSVLFANYRGRGDETAAQHVFTLSILYGLALSALAVLFIGLYREPMLRFFGADDELLALTLRYLSPILFAVPCCVFSNILSAFLRNDGNPSLATKSVVIAGVFNAVGDYVCVFVLDMGIFGAGIATSAAQFISIGVMLLHFVSKGNTLRLVRPAHALRRLADISVTGFSTAISDLSMGIIGILFNRQIMAYLHTDALAVYGIITQITAFAQCLSYGIGQAAQPIISQSYGAGRHERIRECLTYSLQTSAVMGVFWASAMLLAPQALVRMFMTPTPSVLQIAPGILRAYGVSYLLLPFNIFAAYYFQAIMQPTLSMVSSVARGVVLSGAAILLLPVFFGADSIWYAMLLTEILVFVCCAYCMKRCMRALRA